MITKNKEDIEGKPGKRYNNSLLACICVTAITIITYFVFSPSLNDGFTNWDDNIYVNDNTLVVNNSVPVTKIFETPVSSHYHPLTVLSLALNYQSGKLDPFGYHLENVILHLLNTLLVFIFIFLLTRRNLLMAAIVSLFFGIHPMHVESVAWVSGRKDVLYALFFMAGLITYLWYRETKKMVWYFFTLLWFILSCLSKEMAIVFPIILLLIDYLQGLKRERKLLIEKIPFFLFAIIFGIISIKSQLFAITDLKIESGNAISVAHLFTFPQRLLFTSYGAIMYIVKLFVPYKLSAFYPYADTTAGTPILFYISPFLLLGIIAALAYFFLKKEKEIVFGLLFYFASIVFVLQIMSVGRTIIADRYSYLSYIGLLFVVAYLINKVWQNKSGILSSLKYPIIFITIAGAVALGFQTYARTQVWKNSGTLWSDVIDNYPDVSIAYLCRGNYYCSINEFDKAIPDMTKAIQLGSVVGGCTIYDYQSAYYDRAVIYSDYYNNIDCAIADYTHVIAINDTFKRPYYNRALLYSKEGKNDLAIADFTKIIDLDPTFANAYTNRAVLNTRKGNINPAMADYNKAISLDSTSAVAYNDRGLLFLNFYGRNDLAIADYNKAIRHDPTSAIYYYDRGLYYKMINQCENAVADFTKAVQLNPQNAGYYNMSGICNITLQKYNEAIIDFSKAIDIDPSVAGYWNNRSVSENKAGQTEMAKADVLKAQQLQGK